MSDAGNRFIALDQAAFAVGQPLLDEKIVERNADTFGKYPLKIIPAVCF